VVKTGKEVCEYFLRKLVAIQGTNFISTSQNMHIIKRLRMIDDLLGMIRHGMDSVACDPPLTQFIPHTHSHNRPAQTPSLSFCSTIPPFDCILSWHCTSLP